MGMINYFNINKLPSIGDWYSSQELDNSNSVFEVIAMDEEEKTIEIQYSTGEIEELDFATWRQLNTINVAAPYNYLESYGLDYLEEINEHEDIIHPINSKNPISSIEPESDELDWHQKFTR